MKVQYAIGLVVVILLVNMSDMAFAQTGQSPDKPPFPGTKTEWRGFDRYDFEVDGRKTLVVLPKQAAAGNPWIWRAEFFDHRPETDVALVEKGFNLVYMDVGNTFGCPDAMKHWMALYMLLSEKYGPSKQPALEGLSRGGLYVYNWAAANPDKVSCIYGDNPVCDFKSWPGGKGKSPGSPDDWKSLIQCYHFDSESQALAFDKNPIDNLKPLAEAKIPVLHLCGDADEVVPYDENTVILKERYEKLGGRIEVIIKKGFKHHPTVSTTRRPSSRSFSGIRRACKCHFSLRTIRFRFSHLYCNLAGKRVGYDFRLLSDKDSWYSIVQNVSA